LMTAPRPIRFKPFDLRCGIRRDVGTRLKESKGMNSELTFFEKTG